MLLTLLTQTINTIIKDIEPVDVRVATGCLLYSYLNNQDNKIDLRNKALAFKDYYYSQCIEKKITNRTIGFINIEKIVKNKKLQDISTISNSDYENILKWYNVSDLEVKFNPDDLDPRTYGTISFKSNYEKEKFSELHNNYLKPISLYYRNKYNILFKLKKSSRCMIGNSLRNNGYPKESKTENILGLSFEDFKLYLESKFEYWMNWENYGLFNGELNYGWDIDHIIPLNSAQTKDDIIRLNHYTNLQPLCSYINRHIKMYKIQ